MTLDKKTVERVAKIARLNIEEREVGNICKEISEILSAFNDLKKVKTDGIEPAFHPIELRDALREDKAEECLSVEVALDNAEQKEKGFIKGPRAV